MKNIILASKSPYRAELLKRLGIEFECIDSQFDENPLKLTIQDPVELTQKLATAKARSINLPPKSAIIIGSDQVCYHEGKFLGKTGSLDLSLEQLKSLQGQEHQLITSYCIFDGENEYTHTNITKLKMRKLTELQLKNYLSTDNPIDCAGSYKLELNGISLFEKIDTGDYTAIIGLPLIQLANDLIELGVQIPPGI